MKPVGEAVGVPAQAVRERHADQERLQIFSSCGLIGEMPRVPAIAGAWRNSEAMAMK